MKITKVLSTLGFIMFAFFCRWQFNDASQYGTPQWLTYGWEIGYGLLSLLCLINFFRPLPGKFLLALGSVALVLTIYRSMQIEWGKGNILYNEANPAGNESGGLLIMAVWLLLLGFTQRKINC